MTNIKQLSTEQLLARIELEEKKIEDSQPKGSQKKTTSKPKPKRQQYYLIKNANSVTEFVTSAIDQSGSQSITMADLGHRYATLVGKTWKDSAQPLVGTMRHFIEKSPLFSLNGDTVVKAGASNTSQNAPSKSSPSQSSSTQKNVQKAPQSKVSAPRHSEAHSNKRDERGCGPSGGPSPLFKVIRFLLVLVGLVFAFCVLLHSEKIPALSNMPALQPTKNMIQNFVTEWEESSLRAQAEIDALNAEHQM